MSHYLRECPGCQKRIGAALTECPYCGQILGEQHTGGSAVEAGSPPQALSPWLTIWIRPRDTIRRIVDTDPTRHVLLLAALNGFAEALARGSARNAGDTIPLPVFFGIAVTVAPIFAIITLYISGALFRWTGSWLGGEATSEEVRAALAWSSIPNISALLLWVPTLALFGEQMFTSEMPRLYANRLLMAPLLGWGVGTFVVGMWSLVLWVMCFSEVHRFSVWRGLAAMVLGSLVVLVPLLCLAFALSGFSFGP